MGSPLGMYLASRGRCLPPFRCLCSVFGVSLVLASQFLGVPQAPAVGFYLPAVNGWQDAQLSAVSPFPHLRGLSPREKVHFLNFLLGTLNEGPNWGGPFPKLAYLERVRGFSWRGRLQTPMRVLFPKTQIQGPSPCPALPLAFWQHCLIGESYRIEAPWGGVWVETSRH